MGRWYSYRGTVRLQTGMGGLHCVMLCRTSSICICICGRKRERKEKGTEWEVVVGWSTRVSRSNEGSMLRSIACFDLEGTKRELNFDPFNFTKG